MSLISRRSILGASLVSIGSLVVPAFAGSISASGGFTPSGLISIRLTRSTRTTRVGQEVWFQINVDSLSNQRRDFDAVLSIKNANVTRPAQGTLQYVESDATFYPDHNVPGARYRYLMPVQPFQEGLYSRVLVSAARDGQIRAELVVSNPVTGWVVAIIKVV